MLIQRMIFRGQTADFVFQELESEHLTVMPVQSNESHPKELRSTPKLRVATVDGWNLANHLGWSWNPINNGIKLPINWCRISAINSMCVFFSPKRFFQVPWGPGPFISAKRYWIAEMNKNRNYVWCLMVWFLEPDGLKGWAPKAG